MRDRRGGRYFRFTHKSYSNNSNNLNIPGDTDLLFFTFPDIWFDSHAAKLYNSFTLLFVLLYPLLVTIETLFNPNISRRALTIVKRVMIERCRERAQTECSVHM